MTRKMDISQSNTLLNMTYLGGISPGGQFSGESSDRPTAAKAQVVSVEPNFRPSTVIKDAIYRKTNY